MADDTIRRLGDAEAREFAVMVLSGAPVADVVPYFWTSAVDEAVLLACEEWWPRQTEVVEAIQQLTGGEPWHQLTDEARWDLALTKHYNELAYVLWTTNYAEVTGPAKAKADTCRQAMEAKVAGMAGTESPLSRFYHDLLARYETTGATAQ
jgi:hypothetical protein